MYTGLQGGFLNCPAKEREKEREKESERENNVIFIHV